MADADLFSDVRKLLLIEATSPISSSEAERVASGIRTLKTAFRRTLKDERENDLNLIQIHAADGISIEEVVQIFLRKIPRRLLSSSLVFTETSK